MQHRVVWDSRAKARAAVAAADLKQAGVNAHRSPIILQRGRIDVQHSTVDLMAVGSVVAAISQQYVLLAAHMMPRG